MKEFILKNCTVYDEGHTLLKDIYIKNGIIHKIHDSIDLCDKQVINCSGKLLLPGMIDSHLHIPGDILYKSYGICLNDCKTVGEYIEKLKEYVTAKGQRDVVLGFGWIDDVIYKSKEYKNKVSFANLIDNVFPNIPVVLYSMDFHSAWCNTTALKLMGITSNTSVCDNGKIELTKDGELSGFLRGNATDYIKKKEEIFSFSEDEFEDAFKKYQSKLISCGITSVNTFMFIGINATKAWAVLKRLEARNELIININGYVPAEPLDDPKEVLDKFRQLQLLNTKKIRINTVKIYLDGVVENKTAFLKKPYENSATDVGFSFWDKGKLIELCMLLNMNSIQIHAHTIGDAAIKLFLEALDESQRVAMSLNSRHVATHIQLFDLSDMAVLKKTQVIACVQPFWINNNLNEQSLDYIMLGERAKEEYRINSFLKEGIVLTSSSDSPVTENLSPFIAIDRAINRKGDECAGLVDMINSYTCNAAFQLKRENEIGYVREGMNADLILVSQNIYNECTNELKQTKILLTIIDGKIVYNCL